MKAILTHSILLGAMALWLAKPASAVSVPELNESLQNGNVVRILFRGDSMSEVAGTPNRLCASQALSMLLKSWYGDAGRGFIGWDLGWSPDTFSRPEVAHIVGNPSLLRSSDGANALRLQQGLWWAPAGQIYRFGLFVLADSLGGTIKVRHVGIGVDETFQLVSGYSSQPTMVHTNWPISGSQSNCFYITQIEGQNRLWPEVLTTNTGGVIDYYWSKGGTTVYDTLSVGETAFTQMVSAINPQLILWHSKHFGANGLANTASNVTYCLKLAAAAATNCLVAMVGTPPDIIGSESWNPTIREMCRTNKWQYVDLYSAFPIYEAIVDGGLMLDGLHPTDIGGRAWASELYQLLGFCDPNARTNPGAIPPLLVQKRYGEKLTVTFRAEADLTYGLLSSDDLCHWTLLSTNTPATDGALQFVLPIRNAPGTFYRVVTP